MHCEKLQLDRRQKEAEYEKKQKEKVGKPENMLEKSSASSHTIFQRKIYVANTVPLTHSSPQ